MTDRRERQILKRRYWFSESLRITSLVAEIMWLNCKSQLNRKLHLRCRPNCMWLNADDIWHQLRTAWLSKTIWLYISCPVRI